MNTFAYTSLVILLVSSSRMMVRGNPYSEDKCGETRGCFDCRDSRSTCEVNVAWEPDTDEGVVKFNLWGSKTGSNAHVSMGITSTPNMFDADVYSCISNGTGGVLVRSWNPSSPARRTNQGTLKGVFDHEVTEVDGEIRCQFYRNMSLNDGDPTFLDISGNNSYYLILSRGGAGGGAILGHDGSNRGLSGALVLSEELDSFSTMSTTTQGIVTPTQSSPISVRYGAWTLTLSLILAFLVNI